jgi:hypothetical protein
VIFVGWFLVVSLRSEPLGTPSADGTVSPRQVAGAIRQHDRERGYKDLAELERYEQRVSRLMELTGGDAATIYEQTTALAPMLEMHAFQFMSATITFSANVAPDGAAHYPWRDYKQAAVAFTVFVTDGVVPPAP